MPNPQTRGWGDPGAEGSAAATKYRKNHIVQVNAGGVKLNVRGEVAHLFKGFCDEIVARGYRLDVNADDWGYNNRDIRGRPGVKSNHAWGLAIDLNSDTNPMTADGKVHTDMPDWVRGLAHKWGLFWGADYSGNRKDPMHFEFLGAPADVANYPSTTQEDDMTPDQAAALDRIDKRTAELHDVLAQHYIEKIVQWTEAHQTDPTKGGGAGQIDYNALAKELKEQLADDLAKRLAA